MEGLDQLVKIGGPVVAVAAFAIFIVYKLALAGLLNMRESRKLIIDALNRNTETVERLRTWLQEHYGHLDGGSKSK